MMIGVFMALLILFGAFLNFSTSRRFSSQRLSRILLAREFSSALATLACHQLKDRELKDLTGKLVRSLSFPLQSMAPVQREVINFDSRLTGLISQIVATNSELRNLSYKVSWEARKDDFIIINPAYPREKIGFIRIPIEVAYKAPLSEDMINEDYLYTINVKAVANMVPVLSKFSLYINDARSGGNADRFNLVLNDSQGNLRTSSTYRPWVLNNGEQNEPFPRDFAQAIRSPRGLVYLGGGALNLSLARAFEMPGEYGEGFLLRGEGHNPSGMISVDKIGQSLYVLQMEVGMAEPEPGNLLDMSWHEYVSGGYDEMARKSSLFRLFGTDSVKTPTVVFGNIKSRTLAARLFKDTSFNAYNPLPFAASDVEFDDFCSGSSEIFDISRFADQHQAHRGSLSRAEYNNKYASAVEENPYNRALGFIISNYLDDWPLSSANIGSKLGKFISGTAITDGTANKIPAPFDSIYPSITDLSAMQQILDKIQILGEDQTPGYRCAARLKVFDNESLLETFEKFELLEGNKLDLSGWYHIKSNKTIEIDQSIRLLSHGGIVLEKGDIRVSNQVVADSGDFFLTLIALDGNIIIDSAIGGELDLALIAAGSGSDSGQVKFAGNVNSSVPTINGNIAMQRINDLENQAARGVKIDYRQSLSALPRQVQVAGSEQSLLMFSLEYPRLVH